MKTYINVYNISGNYMNKQQLVRSLFDNKILNVLDIFIENPDNEFFLKEVSEQSRVSLTSCYRIVRKLLKLKLVKEVKVSRFVVYQLNPSDHTTFLESIIVEEKHHLDDFIDRIKDTSGVSQIILHGVETKDKANILIIGENLNLATFKPVIADFRLNKRFTISALTLDSAQYEQMSEMGLYSGRKKVLFGK